MKLRSSLLAGLAVLCLQGCGATDMDSFLDELELPDMGWSGEDDQQELEVPPELDAPKKKNHYNLVSMRDDMDANRVLPSNLNMSLYGEGGVTWLTIGAAPDVLWPHLIDFWSSNGFVVADEDRPHGSMRIAWRERSLDASRALGIRVRDMFRLRMEREPDSLTNIYLANRRAQFIDGEWRMTPSDQEIEVEIFQDLIDYLGGVAGEGDIRLPRLERVDTELEIRNLRGVPVLSIGQSYSSVWRRLGVTLDRVGLAVRKVDRSRGIYLIEFSARSEVVTAADEGTLPRGRLLQIHLLSKNGKTLVTVHGNYQRASPPDYDTAYAVLQRIVQGYHVRT